MSDIAIRIDGVSKQYRIGSRQKKYETFREALVSKISSFSSKNKIEAAEERRIWALKDVSFQVQKGEVLGVVGSNGAGKSTLLKILSRITEATSGTIRIHGRVTSLLEVGTGFHPELTGRENIFLNGAILGMKKSEIQKKLEEIIEFADVEKFINTPVKHYSSGMYVRLAFSVAAHLETEILLVDEVLAVGDIAFQKKCIGKMENVVSHGKTVMLVTHNIAAIQHLCNQSILMEEGRLKLIDKTSQVVAQYYLSSQIQTQKSDFESIKSRSGLGEIRLLQAEIIPQGKDRESPVLAGEGFIIRIKYKCALPVKNPVFSVAIYNYMGIALFAVHTSDLNFQIKELKGAGFIELVIEKANLMPGKYLLHFAAGDETDAHSYDHLLNAMHLEIGENDIWLSGKALSKNWSSIFFPCAWRVYSE